MRWFKLNVRTTPATMKPPRRHLSDLSFLLINAYELIYYRRKHVSYGLNRKLKPTFLSFINLFGRQGFLGRGVLTFSETHHSMEKRIRKSTAVTLKKSGAVYIRVKQMCYDLCKTDRKKSLLRFAYSVRYAYQYLPTSLFNLLL